VGCDPRTGGRGVTLFLTTPYLEEADQLADRIAVLDRGRIVAEGTPGDLKRRIPGGHLRLQFTALDALQAAERALATASRDEDDMTLRVPGDGNIAPCAAYWSDSTMSASRSRSCRSTPQTSMTCSSPSPAIPRRRRPPCNECSRVTMTDSVTMLRRNLRRLRRYPSLMLVGMPIVFLLLFVYVFGGQLGAGLGRGLDGGHAGRAGYLNYVTPGILLMTVAAAVQGTAIVVAMDMTGGIIDRFRTMAIARASVLTGHVLASLIQTLVSIAVVLGVAIALGFRPNADAAHWLAAIGVLALFTLRGSGSLPHWVWPPRASKTPATRPCS